MGTMENIEVEYSDIRRGSYERFRDKGNSAIS